MRGLLIFAVFCHSAWASMWVLPFGTKFRGRSMGGELALDVYESYFSLNTDLRERHTIRAVKNDELELYGLMLKNAFVPGYISVQASGYPLLITSAYLEKNQNEFFHKFSFADGKSNLFTLLSSEFTDPAAYSLFLGEIINFRKQFQGKPPESGYGLMGYIVSYGPHSSFDNEIIADNWLELKWRIKGLKKYEEKKRTWDMILGYTFHENPQFFDVFVFRMERKLKSRRRKITLLENTVYSVNFAISPDLPIKTFLTKQIFGFRAGVYYPLGQNLFLKVSTGIRRELIKEDGELNPNYQISFSPSVSF